MKPLGTGGSHLHKFGFKMMERDGGDDDDGDDRDDDDDGDDRDDGDDDDGLNEPTLDVGEVGGEVEVGSHSVVVVVVLGLLGRGLLGTLLEFIFLAESLLDSCSKYVLPVG